MTPSASHARAAGLWFWAAAAFSLLLAFTPWGGLALYPFRVFTTWVHESGHAVAALAVGGGVRAITIAADGSGLTTSAIPAGRLAQGIVASAGYLGTALVGCLLMVAARAERWGRAILWGLGALMLLSALFWVRNLFGLVVVLLWAGALLTVAVRARGGVSQFLLGLLAVQVALNAVTDIRVLFMPGIGHSDATTMAELFLLPSWVWASGWMVLSAAMLGWTLWVTRPPRASS